MELLQEAEFWVGIGLLIFLGIVVAVKVPKLIAGKLDDKAAAIQSELDEAKRIRQEAEALLAQLKTERAEAEKNSAQMLKDAQAQAKLLAEEAAAKLEESLARRSELAERKIATAEAQAQAEVKAAAVELAANMAEQVLASRVASLKNDPLVDIAIRDLGSKLQ